MSIKNSNKNLIDIRSDASTVPTQQMREAMSKAVVGDDVYEDDQTTIELEQYAANLVGKEAALFVPSGTFGNQCSIMALTQRGDEMIVGDKSHIIQYELAGTAFLSGVVTRTVQTSSGGLMDLQNVEDNIRKGYDVHFPTSKLLAIQNPTCQGVVADLEYMKNFYNLAKKYDMKVHYDGARIFNAASYLNVEAKEIAQYSDTVMFCLSKGLCSPIGSMICGSADFIKKARYYRKLIGGGMRQTGIMSAAGLLSLKKHVPLLKEDQQIAIFIAEQINQRLGDYIEKIDIQSIHINILFFYVKDHLNFNSMELVEFMKKQGNVLMLPEFEPKQYRVVSNYYIREKEASLFVQLLEQFFQQLK